MGSPGWRHERVKSAILGLLIAYDEDIAIPFAPDLAIEIISNSEIAARAEKKVREYLASGVQEVWHVYPPDRFVRVRAADRIRDLGKDQFLKTPVLPGFQVEVQAFFAR